MFEPVFLAQQALNGLSFGALLFLLASGLTLVFGLMRIINLAHGAFYMIGGYLGVVVAGLSGGILRALSRHRYKVREMVASPICGAPNPRRLRS